MSLFILGLTVAVISRIVTQEAIFAELQQWARDKQMSRFMVRKVTYPLQCQFCFSVWVAIAIVLFLDWPFPWEYLVIRIATSVGLANALLVSYEYLTAQITRVRLGNKLRTVTLERRELELHEFKADQEIIELQRQRALDREREINARHRAFVPTNAPEFRA